MGQLTKESLAADVLRLLRTAKEAEESGKPNRLAELRAVLEFQVDSDFDSAYYCARKNQYLMLDKDGSMRVTEAGDRVLKGTTKEAFDGAVQDYLGASPKSTQDLKPIALELPKQPESLAKPAVVGGAASAVITQDLHPQSVPQFAELTRIAEVAPQPILLAQQAPVLTTSASRPAPGPEPVVQQPSIIVSPLVLGAESVVTRAEVLPPTPEFKPEAPKTEATRLESPKQPLATHLSVAVPPAASLPKVAELAPIPTKFEEPKSQEYMPTAEHSATGPIEVPFVRTSGQRYGKGAQVGTGPLTQVYQAEDSQLGGMVLLKEFKEVDGILPFVKRKDVVAKASQYIRAQAKLKSPAIARVLAVEFDSAMPSVYFEWAPTTLKQKLSLTAGLSLRESLLAFVQIVQGLRAAHRTELYHSGLKPENILFDSAGNALVADFGMTQLIETGPGKQAPQVFFGTSGLGYMAPEQMAGKSDGHPTIDIYAAGILLYEMLTGSIPGRRAPLPSQVRSEVPTALDTIFDRMTADRREQRYQRIDDVLNDLFRAFPTGELGNLGELVIRVADHS